MNIVQIIPVSKNTAMVYEMTSMLPYPKSIVGQMSDLRHVSSGQGKKKVLVSGTVTSAKCVHVRELKTYLQTLSVDHGEQQPSVCTVQSAEYDIGCNRHESEITNVFDVFTKKRLVLVPAGMKGRLVEEAWIIDGIVDSPNLKLTTKKTPVTITNFLPRHNVVGVFGAKIYGKVKIDEIDESLLESVLAHNEDANNYKKSREKKMIEDAEMKVTGETIVVEDIVLPELHQGISACVMRKKDADTVSRPNIEDYLSNPVAAALAIKVFLAKSLKIMLDDAMSIDNTWIHMQPDGLRNETILIRLKTPEDADILIKECQDTFSEIAMDEMYDAVDYTNAVLQWYARASDEALDERFASVRAKYAREILRSHCLVGEKRKAKIEREDTKEANKKKKKEVAKPQKN